MSSPQPKPSTRPTAASRAINRAKQSPTNENIVDALDNMYGEMSEMRADVATIKTDMSGLKTDVRKLLDRYGLVSGDQP